MALQQAAMHAERERGLGRLARWLRGWALLAEPAPLVGYVVAVVAADLAGVGWELSRTPQRPAELMLFAALLACGAACIEASRRLTMPAGVSRDLLSAWWLPIALLLPPVYALLAPIPLGVLLQVRVRKSSLYRRVFSAAALGLAGACASVAFGHFGLRAGTARDLAAWFTHTGSLTWFSRPVTLILAVACAALFSVVNAAIVAVAAYASEPLARWRDVFWDAESLTLDVTEDCVGVLVTIACVLSPVLLFVSLPPVILLQRSLLHQQLRAAARTDAKTGLLNAAAWQREAEAEIGRSLRSGAALAVLLVDIDHFKRVNDTHGHLVGDQVLAALADALREQVRAGDMVGRFGGEEFVVLLSGADAAEASKVAERLREQVGDTATMTASAEVIVTVSIGAAVLGVHGEDLPGLLAAADLALYRAKAAGRDRVCLPAPRLPTATGSAAPAATGSAAPKPAVPAPARPAPLPRRRRAT
jgi:diguanylate cyclase (GGDEF)-like protein